MNKEAFIKNLENKLSTRISYEELNNIINYYNEYIEEAISFGEKESDVIEDLGDIDLLANNLITELESNGIDISKKELAIIKPISTNTLIEKIVIKSIINNINIEFIDIEDFIAVVENDNYFVEYIQTLENGIYTFKPKIDNIEIKNASWSKVTKPLMTLNLKLPKNNYLNNNYLDIKIDNVSGDININGSNINIDGDLKINSVNGKISLKDFKLNNIHTELVNGKNITNNINAKKITLNKVNGNSEINNLEAYELKMRSVNGAINFNNLKSKYINIDIVNGNCNGYLPYLFNEIDFNIKPALFGSIHINNQKYAKNQLINNHNNNYLCSFKLKTLSGKINILTKNN